MSGSLSKISSIVGKASSVFNAVSQLFGGGGGVQLGDVTFADFEVPEVIKWGGKQDIVHHRLPGGVVILNAMGIEYPPISWSGIFDGYDALDRSRQLYTMMNEAKLVSLTWNDCQYTVLVSSYEAHDTKVNWIPYNITCMVLRDETLSQGAPAPSLLSQVTADVAGAIGITPSQLTSTVGTALTTVKTAAAVVGAVTGGSSAALALTGAVGLATGVVNGAVAVANSGIAKVVTGAIASGTDLFPAGSAVSAIANLGSVVTHASSLAALPVVGGLLGRVTTNMANAST